MEQFWFESCNCVLFLFLLLLFSFSFSSVWSGCDWTGAHRCVIYVTMTRRTQRSEACVTWSQWIQLVWCPISYSSAMQSRHGWIRRVIYMPWYRRFSMVSRHKLVTKIGDASLINSRRICPSAWWICMTSKWFSKVNQPVRLTNTHPAKMRGA